MSATIVPPEPSRAISTGISYKENLPSAKLSSSIMAQTQQADATHKISAHSTFATSPEKMQKSAAEPHFTDLPITLNNWYRHINWLNVTLIVFIPIYGIYCAYVTPLYPKTFIFSFWYYLFTGFGITAGYHRLWAHSSYRATTPLKIFLALTGGGAVEGSIRWWSRDHRAHHRYTDTNKDPYSVRKGLLYSHFGWMIMVQNPKRIGRVDISDLNEDPIVVWQHRHYLKVVLVMALLFPSLVCGLGWGDYWGGFVFAGLFRIFGVQQATFCVNSLAHWLGDQPFDDRNSPRDHLFTAIVTLGEGYHNFHHEFPSDYRNAIEWWQYDPTKWFIRLMKFVGLAYDLKTFSPNAIEMGRVQQLQKKLDGRRTKLDWGVPIEKLPVVEWEDYVKEVQNGRQLISISGVIHDVSGFIDEHPGGKAMIRSGLGKDATAVFNGGVYMHSNAAHNVLSAMRVGVIRGGMEVEIWKREMHQGVYMKTVDGSKIIRAASQVTKTPVPLHTAKAA